MGAFTAYALYTAVFLIAAYLVYKSLLADCRQPSLNRLVLLGIYVMALAAQPVCTYFAGLGGVSGGAVGTVTIPQDAIGAVIDTVSEPMWPVVLVCVYIGGVLVTAVWTVVSMLRLRNVLANGEVGAGPEGTHLVIVDDDNTAPFSWSNYIIMSRADAESEGADFIVMHELAHIRHRHSADIVFARIVCILQWFNPAAWLMCSELRAVHEYQADGAVLDAGVDPRSYQMLIIKKAVGTRFQSLANSLNHSNLKKRITMMYNPKSTAWRRIGALAVVPALALALFVTKVPAVAGVLSATSHARLMVAEPAKGEALAATAVSTDKDTKKSQETTIAVVNAGTCTMPAFPGGERALFGFMSDNIKYPEEAEKANVEGRVVVRFTVAADGSVEDPKVIKSVHPLLDAEAVRVVKSMPKWTPGLVDDKPVALTYVLPVEFKLAPDMASSTQPFTFGKVDVDAAGEEKLTETVVVSHGDNAPGKATTIVINKSAGNDGAKPVIFVDGERYDGELNSIPSDKIESITVIKNKSDFPNGLIEIVLKKQ